MKNGYFNEFTHERFYLRDYFVFRNPADGIYHLFYNIGKAGPKQHWKQPFNENQFGRATTQDLRTWKIHAYVLPVVPNSWESDVVYTGFGDNANQRMGLAVSDDLFAWDGPESPVPFKHRADMDIRCG